MNEPTEHYPATYKCFDCGHEIEGRAESGSFVGRCPVCRLGMLLVYTLNGEPKNRGYWPTPSAEAHAHG